MEEYVVEKDIVLRQPEYEKYECIKEYCEHGGNRQIIERRMNIHKITFWRWMRGFKEHGAAYFVHGNRDRKPAHAIPEETKGQIAKIYRDKYFGWNYEHACEWLEKENIRCSPAVLRKICHEYLMCSPRSTRKTKRRIKTAVRHLEKQKDVAGLLPELTPKDENREAHPTRPRKEFFGELQQMDASREVWFGTEYAHLHAFIDDATGIITGAYFDKEETLAGYYRAFAQVLNNYGVPLALKGDNRTVFIYKSQNNRNETNDSTTQFAYACKELGVTIETTSCPQSKGRIERTWGTHQDRLINELKILGITDMAAANNYLINRYIPKHNRKFALDYKKFKSLFVTDLTKEDINMCLSVKTERIVDKGNAVKFRNSFFATINPDGSKKYLNPGTRGMVINALDGTAWFKADKDSIYKLSEIPSHESGEKYRLSDEEVKKEREAEKEKRAYIPPSNHCWRRFSVSGWRKHKEMQPHLVNYLV